MKKKILGLALALVMIISLLPLTAFAEATVKKVDLMVGTDYAIALEAADDGSIVTYTKNKEVDMTDSTGAAFKGWAQEIVTVTNEATDEWNTKFFYNADASQWQLVLKGAKMDALNEDTGATVSSSYTISASNQNNSAYTISNMYIVVAEDSYLASTTTLRSNCGGASGKWTKSLNLVSEGAAKLYMNYTSYGVYTQCDVNINANLVMTGDADSTAIYMNKTAGVLSFNGGESVFTDYRLCAGGNRIVNFNGGSFTATLTNRVASGEFSAADSPKVKDTLCYTMTKANGTAIALNDFWKSVSVVFNSHELTLNADDGDCTTAVTCTCGKEAIAAKEHVAGANDDCTKATPCANEGCTKDFAAAVATAHVPGADDGDCTTDILCSNAGCAQVATKGAEKHVWDRTSCDVAGTCTTAGCTKTIEAGTHTGGTATCKDKAKCAECGKEYGELGACAPAADDGDCTTDIKCSVCEKVTTKGETAHKYTDKNDTTCDNAGCTNTRKVEGTENPKTGDNSAIAVVAALMVTAAAAFVTTKKFAR